MKPIEEGCLAMVVKSHGDGSNYGKVGRVGKFIGGSSRLSYKDVWEFDAPQITTTRKIVYLQREAYLMRIDGYEEEIKETALEEIE